MSEWPKYNVESHEHVGGDDFPKCLDCEKWSADDWCERCKWEEYGDPWEALERVRKVLESGVRIPSVNGVKGPLFVNGDDLRRALDGDSDA